MLKNILAKLLFAMLPCIMLGYKPDNSLLRQWEQAKTKAGYAADTSNITLLNHLAEHYRYNNADSALYFAKQALQLAYRNHHAIGQANAFFLIGTANYIKGAYFPSLEAASQLMTISQRINYRPGIANVYQLRGLIFLAQDELDDALIEFTKALKVYTQLKNKGKMARMYFDIGLCYDELKQPKKAFIYLEKAFSVGKSAGDEHIISMTFNRKGETYFHVKDYKQALVHYQLVLSSGYQDNWENAFALSGIAQTYYALGNYDKAVVNAEKSVDLALAVNSMWDAARALKILTQSYATLGNYKQAYHYSMLMNKYTDSLLNDTKQKKINYLQLKQQRSDNLRLEKENEIHTQKMDFNRLLIIGIGLLAVFISIFAIIISRSNIHKTSLNKKLERRNKSIALQKEEISKQNEKLDQLNQTKNQLFSVISHDLRSPFSSVLQTMDLIRSGDLDKDEQEMILDKFHEQLVSVTGMVNNLLLWANSQQDGLKSKAVKIDAAELIEDILPVYASMAASKNITLVHTHDGEKMAFADMDHFKIIIQNLVGNAVKFTGDGGNVVINYTKANDFLVISIKDDGIGIAAEKMEKLFKVVGKEISGYGTNKEVGAGIGLLLIKQFIEANKGKLEINSKPGKGTEALVYLPIA
ncbi:MAG: tetratricopeptide repeat-containing sensor histidine kinase [Mucilaginibacter sp.]